MINFKIKWNNTTPKKQLNKTIDFFKTIDWTKYEVIERFIQLVG